MRYRFGKFAQLAFLLFLLPATAQAVCSATGYTVIFVNGVFDTEDQAKEESIELSKVLGSQYNSEPITFRVGYNQTHLQGVGDLIESVFPSFDQYDLNTILLQIYPEVRTRKLLIVGHSQGSVYANSLYNYLTTHGEPASAVAVYDVATPASSVAGGGKYLTSAEDVVINTIRGQFGFSPLPPNIDIPWIGSDIGSKFPGHSFSLAYLAGAPDRVVGDIQSELSQLQATSTSDGSCFVPPAQNLAYKAEQAAFVVGDPTATALEVGGSAAYAAAAFAYNTTASAVAALGGFVGNLADSWNHSTNNPAAPQNADKNFGIIKKLYGSSLDAHDLKELMGTDQGAAVAEALPSQPPVLPQVQNPVGVGDASSTPTTSPLTLPSTPQEPTTPSMSSAAPSYQTPPVTSDIGASTVSLSDTNTSSSTTATSTATSTPVLFDATTTPPMLTVAECASSLRTSSCLLSATTVNLSWSAPDGAVSYGVLVNGVQSSTTTDTTAALTLADEASTTISVVAYDADNNATSSNEQDVEVFVPLPALALIDTFDSFSSTTWQTVGQNVQNFIQDDDTDGSCLNHQCVVEGSDFSLIPRMYASLGTGIATGSYTVYAKATQGGSPSAPHPVFSACPTGSACADDHTRVDLYNVTPLDNTWHRYYIAWRQGTNSVESCVLVDDTQPADCSWQDTGLALGTTYDSIELWSSTGYRSDLGAHLWFDELNT